MKFTSFFVAEEVQEEEDLFASIKRTRTVVSTPSQNTSICADENSFGTDDNSIGTDDKSAVRQKRTDPSPHATLLQAYKPCESTQPREEADTGKDTTSVGETTVVVLLYADDVVTTSPESPGVEMATEENDENIIAAKRNYLRGKRQPNKSAKPVLEVSTASQCCPRSCLDYDASDVAVPLDPLIGTMEEINNSESCETANNPIRNNTASFHGNIESEGVDVSQESDPAQDEWPHQHFSPSPPQTDINDESLRAHEKRDRNTSAFTDDKSDSTSHSSFSSESSDNTSSSGVSVLSEFSVTSSEHSSSSESESTLMSDSSSERSSIYNHLPFVNSFRIANKFKKGGGTAIGPVGRAPPKKTVAQELRQRLLFEVYHSFPAYCTQVLYCFAHVAFFELIGVIMGEQLKESGNEPMAYTCVLVFALLLARISGSAWVWLNDDNYAFVKFDMRNKLDLCHMDARLLLWFKRHEAIRIAVEISSLYLCYFASDYFVTQLLLKSLFDVKDDIIDGLPSTKYPDVSTHIKDVLVNGELFFEDPEEAAIEYGPDSSQCIALGGQLCTNDAIAVCNALEAFRANLTAADVDYLWGMTTSDSYYKVIGDVEAGIYRPGTIACYFMTVSAMCVYLLHRIGVGFWDR